MKMTHTVFNPAFGPSGFLHVTEVSDPHNLSKFVYQISGLEA